MNQEPLPQIYLIHDTDLTTFAYELHIFAGDFLRESEFNMRSLVTNAGRIRLPLWDGGTCGFPMPCTPTVPQQTFTR